VEKLREGTPLLEGAPKLREGAPKLRGPNVWGPEGEVRGLA